MVMKFTNNATSTLASGITSSATSLTVATGNGTLFPTLGAGDYFYCTLANTSGTVEIVKVTARSTDTFTVTRGQDGTSGVAWNSGDKVELRLVAASLNDIPKLDEANTFSANNTFSGSNAYGTPTSIVLTNATLVPVNQATGTLAVGNGGTGLTSTPANGVLDIGNGTNFTRTTLTAGSGITITNGAGSISIASSGGSGVTSLNGQTGAITNNTFQAVGSYAMGKQPSPPIIGSSYYPNATFSGSAAIDSMSYWKYYSCCGGLNSLVTYNPSLSGTWRWMGSNNGTNFSMLMIRIA
jgi:hypothetical protein